MKYSDMKCSTLKAEGQVNIEPIEAFKKFRMINLVKRSTKLQEYIAYFFGILTD